MNEIEKYRASLSPADQAILDELLTRLDNYQMALKAASPEMPQLMALLAMLLEEHKEIQRLKEEIEQLQKR